MATFGEVGNIKESNAKERTKSVEWSNGGSIATFGECGSIPFGEVQWPLSVRLET